LIDTVLATVQQIKSSGYSYAGVVDTSSNIGQMVGVVLDDCGISAQILNVLPDACIEDLQTVAL